MNNSLRILKKAFTTFILCAIVFSSTTPPVFSAPRSKDKVNATFKQGKSAYDQAKYKEAVDIWDTLTPELLEEEPSVKKVIEFLKSKIPAEALQVDILELPVAVQSAPAPATTIQQPPTAESRDLSERKSSEIKIDATAPAPIPRALSQASGKIEDQLFQAKSQKSQALQVLAERQSTIDAGFDKGKKLFDKGHYKEAVAAWRSVLPLISNPSEIEASLQVIEKSLKDLEEAKKDAIQSTAASKQAPAPAQIQSVLAAASEKIKQQMQQAQDLKTQRLESVSVKQEAIEEAFREGNSLFNQGRYNEAVASWRTVLPLLQEPSQIEKAINQIEKSLAEMESAKSEADRTLAGTSQKFKVPADFSQILQEANLELEREAQKAEMLKWKTKNELLDKQKWFNENLSEAKSQFAQGRYEKGLETARVLLPALENPSQIETFLEGIQLSQQNLKDAKKTGEMLTQTQSKKIKAPDELVSMLSEADQKLQTQAKLALNQKASLEKAALEQQIWVNSTFEKGKTLYEQGKIREAIAAWSAITAYLEDGSEIQATLEAVQKSYESARLIDQVAKNMAMNKDQKFKSPDELALMLGRLDVKLQGDILEAKAQKTRAEQAVTERQQWILATFQKGKELYQNGRIQDALMEWDRLAPYLEESSEIRGLVEKVKSSYDAMAKAQAQTAAFASTEYKTLKVPYATEMSQTLEEALAQLETQSQAARQQKSQMEKTLAERKVWIDQTFQKGKLLFDQGQAKEAAQTWSALVPYLETGVQAKAMVEMVLKNAEQARLAEAELQELLSKKDQKFKAPDELSRLLDQAKQDLKTQSFQAQTQKAQSEQALIDRQQWLNQTFQKGKELYKKGDYSNAISAWKEILPYLQDGDQMRTFIQDAEISLENAQEAQKSAEAAKAKSEAKIKTPSELLRSLGELSQRYKLEIQESLTQRSQYEQEAAQKQAFVSEAFQNGKELYAQGKFNEAVEAWKSILPLLEDSSQAQAYLQSVEASLENSREAQKAADAAMNQKDRKFKTPGELLLYLNQAGQKLAADAQQFNAEKAKAEQSIADRRQWIASTFQKGKNLYEKGQVKEAIAAWNLIVPHLDNDEETGSLIKLLDKNFDQAVTAKATFQNLLLKKDQKFAPPSELAPLLQQAAARFDADTSEALSQKQKAESALAEKQSAIQEIFQKGKELYLQGKVTEALEQWDALSPYIEEGSDARKLLDQARTSRQNSMDAKRQALVAASEEYTGFEIPAELVSFLDDADHALRTNIQDLRNQKLRSEKAAFEKQAWINGTFEKGRAFYNAGKIPQALDAWDNLLPYLETQPEIKKQLSELQNTFGTLEEAERAIRESKEKPLQEPAELRNMLAGIDQSLKQKAQEAQNARLASEQDLLTRQTRLTENFQKARSLFKEGKTDEALGLLEQLAPYFEDESGLQALIKNLRASQSNLIEAQKAAQQSAIKREQKFQTPEGFAKMLTQMDKELEAQTKEALSRRAASEQVFSERQRSMEIGFSKGATLLNQGKIKEALDAWSDILSYFEPQSEAVVFIEQARAKYKSLLDAQAQAQAASLRQDTAMKPPADWVKIFADVQTKIEMQTKDVIARRLQMEKAVADRQQWILSTFQAGQAFYERAEMDKAVAEWKKLTPYLDPSSGMTELLDKINQSLAGLDKEKMQTASFSANEYKSLKVPYEGQMSATLSGILSHLDLKTKDALAQRAQMEKTLAERKSWLDQTFRKGKDLFDKNQIPEAIQTWAALTPYLEDGSQIKAILDSVDKNYSLLKGAEAQVREAVLQQGQKFKSPSELSKLLDDTRNMFKAQTFEAQTQKAQSQQALLDRQQALNEAFQRGKNFYKQQKYTDAIETWKEILPYLEEREEAESAINSVEESLRASMEAKKAAQEAAESEKVRLRTPDELSSALSEINNQLKFQTYDAKTRAAKSEKILADRQAFVNSAFEKGSLLYAQGKYYEALTVWKELLPHLEDEDKLLPLIDQARRNYQIQMDAQLSAKNAGDRQDTKFKTPENLGRYLSDISDNYAKETQAYLKEKSQIDQTLTERQAWVQTVFEKGKQFYDVGRYPEAIQEWKSLLPVMQDAAQLETYIKTVEANLENLRRAQSISQSSALNRDAKLPVPVGLPDLLNDAAQKLRNEAFEAENQKTKADQTFSERQVFVKSTFEKGKTFYGEGNYAEAIREWEKLGPYLDEQSGIGKIIEEAKANYASAVASKQDAVEAFAKEYKGLKLSYTDQMVQLLEEANKKLRSEAAANKAKVSDLEKTLAERREWAEDTFNKARVYYDQERYDEAIAQWERLLPYLEDDSAIKRSIISIKQNLSAAQSQVQTAQTLGQAKDKWTDIPEELPKALQEIAKKFEEKARQSVQSSESVEKELAERKEYIRFAYQKGKDFFDQGRDEEALKAWEILTPYLDEAPEIKKLIEEARGAKRSADTAEKVERQIEQKKKQLPLLPQARLDEPVSEEEPADEDEIKPIMQEPPAKTEFVSGEIVEVDPEKQNIKIKLYTVGDKKTLVVNFDQQTQVKGEEQGQSADTLQAGTAVDLRYDPESRRAVYIYVY